MKVSKIGARIGPLAATWLITVLYFSSHPIKKLPGILCTTISSNKSIDLENSISNLGARLTASQSSRYFDGSGTSPKVKQQATENRAEDGKSHESRSAGKSRRKSAAKWTSARRKSYARTVIRKLTGNRNKTEASERTSDRFEPFGLISEALGQRLRMMPTIDRLIVEEPGISLRRVASSSSSVASISAVPLKSSEQQNTTNLLLFTKPDTGLNHAARLTRYIPRSELLKSSFNPTKSTLLLIHGFRGSSLSQQRWAADIKDLALDRQPGINVLYADWHHHARAYNFKNIVKNKVPEVSEDIRVTLRNLELAFPAFKMENVEVIGHSLGAHIGGLLGQSLDGKLSQITALDPAGPYLDPEPPSKKLTQDDARQVIAYHTSSRWLGTEKSLADYDIYFNGGSEQPMCRDKLLEIPGHCAHKAAGWLASTYMSNCRLVAYTCSDYDNFLAGECGFCPESPSGNHSPSCVGVGDHWQYNKEPEAEVDHDMRSDSLGEVKEKLDNRKRKEQLRLSDVQWTRHADKYYVTTGPDFPYCAFAYQLVIRFSEESFRMDSVQWFTVHLRNVAKMNQTDFRARIRMTHRLRPDARLEVFSGNDHNNSGTWQRPATKIISGSYVFTGMILIESKHQSLYQMMPLKFEQIVFESRFMKDTVVGQPEVYLNFMSSPKFHQRAKYSGRIENMILGNGQVFGSNNNDNRRVDSMPTGSNRPGPRLVHRKPREAPEV